MDGLCRPECPNRTSTAIGEHPDHSDGYSLDRFVPQAAMSGPIDAIAVRSGLEAGGQVLFAP